ncbi:hypothetical protein [Aliikangiella coralliicola]|uniref:Uncharacterized protein n=1 Tax=Aliikangiella coralliicola TaxID=2592383 RepID=A0A545UE24_9GAMM|nr:hypothetical protein [Aliikangiella coralliicola]TQV87716.1 hypothetical protein FLL46_10040 [Aliikangiella coralliicola]
MKFPVTLLLAPALIFITACSTHYSASSHHGYHHGHRGHVSVGVHGHGHSRASDVVGALVVGGIIGHLLTEASHDDEPVQRVVTTTSHSTSDEELVNGYSVGDEDGYLPEVNSEQDRYYQVGQDGNCYLMEDKDGKDKIVTMVPKFSCR